MPHGMSWQQFRGTLSRGDEVFILSGIPPYQARTPAVIVQTERGVARVRLSSGKYKGKERKIKYAEMELREPPALQHSPFKAALKHTTTQDALAQLALETAAEAMIAEAQALAEAVTLASAEAEEEALEEMLAEEEAAEKVERPHSTLTGRPVATTYIRWGHGLALREGSVVVYSRATGLYAGMVVPTLNDGLVLRTVLHLGVDGWTDAKHRKIVDHTSDGASAVMVRSSILTHPDLPALSTLMGAYERVIDDVTAERVVAKKREEEEAAAEKEKAEAAEKEMVEAKKAMADQVAAELVDLPATELGQLLQLITNIKNKK